MPDPTATTPTSGGPASTASPLVDEAVVALRELILSGEHYRITVAVHLGLTVNESQAVSYLFARGPLSQGDLAEAMSFTTSSTTSLVDRLERRGIAERRADPSDRRRSIIALSTAGEVELEEVRTWMAHAFTGLDDDELSVAQALLLRLANGLRTFSDSVMERHPGEARPRRRV